jgi:hypothetical protein
MKIYNVNNIGYFPAFTSSTKNENVAHSFANKNKKNFICGGWKVIFHIYLTRNENLTHFEVPLDL